MSTSWWSRVLAASLSLVIIVAVGCSKDEKKSSTGSISDEEQLAYLEDFFNTYGSSTNLGAAVTSVIGLQAGMESWTEFNCSNFDIDSLFGGLAKMALPINGSATSLSLGKRTSTGEPIGIRDALIHSIQIATTQGDPVCDYNQAAGQWEIAYNETLTEIEFDDLQLPANVVFDASGTVAYANNDGPQMQPDETTNMVSQSIDVEVQFDMDTSSEGSDIFADIGLSLTSSATAMSVTPGMVTINGSTTLGSDIDFSSSQAQGETITESTVSGTAGFGMSTTNVQIATTGNPDDACPIGGRVDGNVDIDLVAVVDGQAEAAKAAWDMFIQFQSNGDALLGIQSSNNPSIAKDTTVTLCVPPL